MTDESTFTGQDYWSIVFRQLRKNKLGLAGLGVVVVLYLFAVFAPFLAESKPIRLVHSNPDDKPCTLCKDLGLSKKKLTLKDGRTFLGRIVKSNDETIVFDHDGVTETFDKKTQFAKAEDLPRQHGPITCYPLLSSLATVDLYLLVSLACILVGVPIFIVLRRRKWSRFASIRIAAAAALPILVVCSVLIHTRTSMLNKLNQVDFPRLAQKRLKAGDTALWPLIHHAPSDQDKRVLPLSKPYPWNLTEDEHARAVKTSEEWETGLKSHLLGTDDQRRDVVSMMTHAVRISLSVGFFSVFIYVSIGVFIGAIAGYFGGWVDAVIMRVIEIIMCFPTLFLIITILALVPPSIFWVMGTIAFVGWTTVARLVRAEFLKLRQQDFVQSARALGASRMRIIFRHILPNAVSPVFVSATFGIAGAILTESALSFLGIGVPIDQATWGNVLRIGRSCVETDWWLALWPGLAIFITVTSFNLFGEALRDAMDPRLKT